MMKYIYSIYKIALRVLNEIYCTYKIFSINNSDSTKLHLTNNYTNQPIAVTSFVWCVCDLAFVQFKFSLNFKTI